MRTPTRVRAGAAAVAVLSVALASHWIAFAIALRDHAGVVSTDDVAGAGDRASVLTLVTWVGTSLWLRELRANAAVLAPQARHVRARPWVAWGWVVPVVNLWFPYQVVRDLSRSVGSAGPVLLWWLLALGCAGSTSTLGELAARAADDEAYRQQLTHQAGFTAVLVIFGIAVWSTVVVRLAAGQDRQLRDWRAQNMTVENRAVSVNPTLR